MVWFLEVFNICYLKLLDYIKLLMEWVKREKRSKYWGLGNSVLGSWGENEKTAKDTEKEWPWR